MTDTVELNEAAVRKGRVDSASTLTEEIQSVGAGQYEHGSINIETVWKPVLLNGTTHTKDLFGKVYTFRPN